MNTARVISAPQTPVVGRQSALDMLRSMAGSVGSDSPLSEQLVAVNVQEVLSPVHNSNTTTERPVLGTNITPLPELPSTSTGDVSGQRSESRKLFHVDTTQLRAVPLSQQASEIQNLGLTVYNQQEFETGTKTVFV